MAKNSSEGRSRAEISETVERRSQEYREKTDALHRENEDIQIERKAIQSIEEALGTLEGMDAVLGSLREAETTSQGEFSQDGAALEQAQSEGEEFEHKLHERSDSTTTEAERIGQGRNQLTSEASANRMEQAENQAREDTEFLLSEEDKARDSRESGQREHDKLTQIVFGTGG